MSASKLATNIAVGILTATAMLTALAVPVWYVVENPNLSDLVWKNVSPDLPRAVLIPVFWLAEGFAFAALMMLCKAIGALINSD